MKVKYTNPTGTFSVELDGDTQRDVFGNLAKFQEVFESSCGKCGSTNLKYVVRTVDDNEYYEIRCLDCGARLAFGCHKKGGGLFPVRKDKEGKWLPNRGWVKWNPNENKAE
jgi:hypothetical protein